MRLTTDNMARISSFISAAGDGIIPLPVHSAVIIITIYGPWKIVWYIILNESLDGKLLVDTQW